MLISPPNDWVSVGQLLLTNGLFYKKVASSGRTTSNKMI